jgi:hypothetical protein
VIRSIYFPLMPDFSAESVMSGGGEFSEASALLQAGDWGREEIGFDQEA